MKKILNFIANREKTSHSASISHSHIYSIPMDFEDNLLVSSKETNSFSDSWVSTELERSKLYFYEKIEEA